MNPALLLSPFSDAFPLHNMLHLHLGDLADTYPKRLSTIRSHIHTLTVKSTTQGDSQLVSSSQGEVPRSGTPDNKQPSGYQSAPPPELLSVFKAACMHTGPKEGSVGAVCRPWRWWLAVVVGGWRMANISSRCWPAPANILWLGFGVYSANT